MKSFAYFWKFGNPSTDFVNNLSKSIVACETMSSISYTFNDDCVATTEIIKPNRWKRNETQVNCLLLVNSSENSRVSEFIEILSIKLHCPAKCDGGDRKNSRTYYAYQPNIRKQHVHVWCILAPRLIMGSDLRVLVYEMRSMCDDYK